MMKSLLLFTIITNPLILNFQTGILIHSVRKCSTLESEAHFRVAKDDIPILLNAFRIPARFKCPQGTACSSLEGRRFTAKIISIHMPLFRFNFNFWTSGARAVHDSLGF